MRYHRSFASLIFPLASLFAAEPGTGQAPTGDWISVYGGPHNDSRAHGQALHTGSGWYKTWEVPGGVDSELLIHGERVYFKRGPFWQGLEVHSGALVWATPQLRPTYPGHRPPCIAAGRLFVPSSRQGCAILCPAVNTAVTAYDLGSGAEDWFWDSGLLGSDSQLQVVPAALSGLSSDRVVLSSLDQGPGFTVAYDWIVLDAAAPSAQSAPLGVVGGVAGHLSYDAPAFDAVPRSGGGSAPSLFAHTRTNVGLNWHSATLRSLDLTTLSAPAPSFTGPLALSGQIVPPSTTLNRTPVVIDPAAHEAYLLESGGLLRSYDLVAGAERWSVPVQATTNDERCYVMAQTVIVPDNGAGRVRGYARSDGALAWELSVGASSLPAAPARALYCVLDGDQCLMQLENGELRAVSGDGQLSPVVLTETPLRSIRASHGKLFLLSRNAQLIVYNYVDIAPRAPFTLGSLIPIDVVSPGDAGKLYIFGFSSAQSPGIPLPNNRIVPLAADAFFRFSVTPNPVFLNTVGLMDNSSRATVSFSVPPFPFFAGLQLFGGLMTFDPPYRVSTAATISPSVPFLVQ